MTSKKLLILLTAIALTSCFAGCARNAKTISKDDLQIMEKDGKRFYCATPEYFLYMCQADVR